MNPLIRDYSLPPEIEAGKYTPHSRRDDHQQIEDQVQAYLERGGKITHIDAGIESDPWTPFRIAPKSKPSSTKPRTHSCSN